MCHSNTQQAIASSGNGYPLGNAGFLSDSNRGTFHLPDATDKFFRVSRNGIWLITADVSFAPNSTGIRLCGIVLTTATIFQTMYGYTQLKSNAVGANDRLSSSAHIKVSAFATDNIYLMVYQDCGVNLNVPGTTQDTDRVDVGISYVSEI